jgi:hypothetical protein
MIIWDESTRRLRERALSRNDRFSAILVMAVVVALLMLGLALRGSALLRTRPYIDRATGIEVHYPADWFLDTHGDYMMRVRDPAARPFRTEYTIRIAPASGQTSVRNVLDALTLQRSNTLSAYRVLSVDEEEGSTRMTFAYVEADPNPFVQQLSVVVRGMDRVILDGNRAIVVTFAAEADHFEDELPGFERFFDSLVY